MNIRNINDAVAILLQARADKKAAEAAEKAAQAFILDAAKDRPTITTDAYTVIIKDRSRTGLDADALRKDFPDIYDAYGKTSTWKQITAQANTASETKTA